MDTKTYHIGRAQNVIVSPCGKYIMSAGMDGVMLIFKVLLDVEGVLEEEDQHCMIVDDFLADVVLVYREEVDKV